MRMNRSTEAGPSGRPEVSSPSWRAWASRTAAALFPTACASAALTVSGARLGSTLATSSMMTACGSAAVRLAPFFMRAW
ncbi:hypothetical protein BC342_33335 [Streptomyces olivaceus]|nr:hypothetical protein BC342_33335 [Streptomyces olivaceus]